ncbi:uncharacterized protein LOC131349463 [Hemibagrus wyckioides]|uniref:uncharacterized protein LOC131349463 n=1 Tax=Hemibagrus wyckioides TaxID=337641 RepID=UPI00266C8C2D|nr:uncharacterized protein LOC131349463 [Hemibagrus wyckioides]
MPLATKQCRKYDQTSSDSFHEDESDRIFHITERLPKISPFAVHHCAHVIFLRAQQATAKDPIETLMLAAKSKQVGQLAESVLKTFASLPELCITDDENIPKKLHRIVIERIYEELLSNIGTPFALMEAFNTRYEKLENAFTLAFLNAAADEDLEPFIFNLEEESESEMTDMSTEDRTFQFFENSTSMSMLLTLKLLANGPPYTVHLDKPPQELISLIVNMWKDALCGEEANCLENLYKKLFIDHCGQVNVEKLFHMKFGEKDKGFHDDVRTEITDAVSPNIEADSEATKKPMKKSWLSRFNIFRIFKKKSKACNKTVRNVTDRDTAIQNAPKSPSRRYESPKKRRSETYTIKSFTSSE